MSLNVLMFIERTGERVPKISDFGLSKMDHGFTATATAAGPLGTPAWSAPEVLNQDGAKPDPFSVRHVEFRCGGVGSNHAQNALGGLLGDADSDRGWHQGEETGHSSKRTPTDHHSL